MQASQKPVIWTLIVVGAVILLGLGFLYQTMPTQQTYPTAEEIAALIVVEIPEQTDDTNNRIHQEIWDELYEDEINRFERGAMRACADEYDFDDIEDLYTIFEDVEFVKEYEDERDFEVIDLGLDDEDDRHGVLTGIIKVRIDDHETDLVYGTCVVTSDDGDLEGDLRFNL